MAEYGEGSEWGFQNEASLSQHIAAQQYLERGLIGHPDCGRSATCGEADWRNRNKKGASLEMRNFKTKPTHHKCLRL